MRCRQALAEVCPHVPIMLWSRSLESRDVRCALDAGARAEVVNSSDRAGLKAAIAAVADQGGRSVQRTAAVRTRGRPQRAGGHLSTVDQIGLRPTLRAGTRPFSAPIPRARDYITRRTLAAADAVAIAVAMAIALLLVTRSPEAGRTLLMSLLALPLWIALFKVYGLYDRDTKRVSHSTVDDVPWLFHALLVGSLGLWAYSKIAWPDRIELAQEAPSSSPRSSESSSGGQSPAARSPDGARVSGRCWSAMGRRRACLCGRSGCIPSTASTRSATSAPPTARAPRSAAFAVSGARNPDSSPPVS